MPVKAEWKCNSPIARARWCWSLLCAGALLLTANAHAAKVLGSCQAYVTGSGVSETIVAAANADQNNSQSNASATTGLWMKLKAEAPGIKGTPEAGMYLVEANSPRRLMTIRCTGQTGSFAMSAAPGSNVDQYPEGARSYRLLGPGSKDLHQGDVSVSLNVLNNGKWIVVVPKEPGELKLTRNDKDELAGTFRFGSAQYTVQGSFRFANPDT